MGTKKKNNPGGCVCCGSGDPECCADRCDFGPTAGLSVRISGGSPNSPASSVGVVVPGDNPCQFILDMFKDAGGFGPDATGEFISYSGDGSGARWKIDYDNETHYTFITEGCQDFTLGFDPAISDGSGWVTYGGVDCHGFCCYPGQTLRMVTGGEVVVAGLPGRIGDEIYTIGAGKGCFNTPAPSGKTCDRCDIVADRYAWNDGQDSGNGTYSAILYDYEPTSTGGSKREVTDSELSGVTGSGASGLFGDSGCLDPYKWWFWDFYSFDVDVPVERSDGGFGYENCDNYTGSNLPPFPPFPVSGTGTLTIDLTAGTFTDDGYVGFFAPNCFTGLFSNSCGGWTVLDTLVNTVGSGTPNPIRSGDWENKVPFLSCNPTEDLGPATAKYTNSPSQCTKDVGPSGIYTNPCEDYVFTEIYQHQKHPGTLTQNWFFEDITIPEP